MAKKLAKQFGSILKLLEASYDELVATDEIGEKIAISIQEYFRIEQNVELIRALIIEGVQMEQVQKELVSQKLAGKTIVISGVFSQYSRDELKQMVEDNGGKNASSISAKTSFVLAGENMGPSKLEKATELGVSILSESDFLSLLNK